MGTNETAGGSALKATLHLQRKAAIVAGGAVDDTRRVRVARMAEFDMKRTIFGGLGGLPKMFMEARTARG